MSDRERQLPYDITYTQNLKYDTNDYEKKANPGSNKEKTDLQGRRGGRGEGVGWTGSLGLVNANYYI